MNVDLTKDSGLIFTAMSTGKPLQTAVPPEASFHPHFCIPLGLTVGAFFFGLLVDIIGRKWAFNLTCLITCVFGTLIVSQMRLESPSVEKVMLIHHLRLPLCTTTTLSAPWPHYVVSALEVRSPLTRLSLLNFCRKTSDTFSRFCLSGNLSESSSPAPLPMDLSPNTDVTLLWIRA